MFTCMFTSIHSLLSQSAPLIGVQFRSSTFQLIKVFFDEEVAPERIDCFRASLLKLRYPASILGFFCFSQSYQAATNSGENLSQLGLDLDSGLNGCHVDQATGSNGTGLHLQPALANSEVMEQYYGRLPVAVTGKAKDKAGADALTKFAKNTLRKAGLMPRKNNAAASAAQQQHLSIRTPETMRKAMRGAHNNELSTDQASDVHGHWRQPSLQVCDSDDENLSSNELTLWGFI